ncbi:hypothetical protein MMC30_000067 [Trapelia coarctata]|nr:hypothetical protein [Trapelia coarctata]
MVQNSGVSTPVGEDCIVAWADMQVPCRTPPGDELNWDHESVPRGLTARHSSNTSDYVVINSQNGPASSTTQPNVCAEPYIPEAPHGGPKLDLKNENGQADERATDQCVEECSTPIDAKEEVEKSTEQRLAHLERQLARSRSRSPRIVRVPEFPPLHQAIPELRRMTRLEFNNRDPSQTRFPAVEALIGGTCYPDSDEANHAQRTTVDGDKPSDDNKRAQASENYDKATDCIRINSKPILLILADLLKQKPSARPQVILHPFKVLVHYENEIRSILRRLEDKWSAVDIEQLSTQTPVNVGRNSEPSTSRMTKAVLAPTQSTERAQGDNHTISGAVPTIKRAKDTDQQSRSSKDTMSPYLGAESKDSLETLRDLRCLVQFMEEDVKPLADRFIDGTCSKVRFEDLWYLFKPGDDVVSPFHGKHDQKTRQSAEIGAVPGPDIAVPEVTRGKLERIWRVAQVGGERQKICFCIEDEDPWPPTTTSKPLKPFVLQCYYVDYNGSRYGPVLRNFEIRPFRGERDITSLEVFPLRFAENANDVRTTLKKRGEIFCDLVTTPQERYYNGMTFVVPGEWLPIHMEGNVVVDFTEVLSRVPDLIPPFADQCMCNGDRYPHRRRRVCYNEDPEFLEHDAVQADDIIDIQRREDLFSSDPILKSNRQLSSADSLPDGLLILLPPRVFAFYVPTPAQALVSLNIKYLHPLKHRSEGFDSLVLPLGHKRMIEALVKSHVNSKRSDTGRLAGHRQYEISHPNGPNILLYGEPGVGKTATAECVAELHGKPLLNINPSTYDPKLNCWKDNIHLAEKWDLIVLLDEVDVLLKMETDSGVQQSVVSWILQTYKGILFLTTNSIHSLQKNFLSRVQLSLCYLPLVPTQIHQIFMANIERLEAGTGKHQPMLVERQSVMQFLNTTRPRPLWNGRRIRDAFESAIAFAHYDAEEQNERAKLVEPAAGFVPALPILSGEHFQRIKELPIQRAASPVGFLGPAAEKDALPNHGAPDVCGASASTRPMVPPLGYPTPTPYPYPYGVQHFLPGSLYQPPNLPGYPYQAPSLPHLRPHPRKAV